MEDFVKPGWLETLWNINPRIAEQAEKELITLYDTINKAKELLALMEQRN